MASALNRTTMEYLESIHTPDYPTESWVVNPDLAAVSGVPRKYWKLTGDVVSEMNQTEKDAADATIANAVIGEKNFLVEEFTANKLTKETWYSTDDGDGTYSDYVEETTYTYLNQKLISKLIQPKWPDGTNRGSAEIWTYHKSGDNTIMKKQGA